MSLCATTSTTLNIIDGSGLKRHASSYDSQRISVPATPKAHAWSPDNNILYIVSSDAIHTFSSTSSAFKKLYQSPQGTILQPVLVSRDKSTLIFAQGSTIQLLAVASSPPKIMNSLPGHSAPVSSLSLCNDASLLASASVSALCVHNLSHNSLTVLKGLTNIQAGSSKNVVCIFHPHTRTRLLVGCGKTLVVYDTTRPSGPMRSIVLSEKDNISNLPNIGYIVAISCSPFSKTLAAVAFNSGFIALVDLDKDRPFFKNLRMKVPVTSMTFTADGSSLALGTENGKVIVQDLRTVENEYRTLPVGDEGKGERVIGLAIQRRIKNSPNLYPVAKTQSVKLTAKLPTSISAPAPLAQHDLNNGVKTGSSPARRIVSSSPRTKAQANTRTPLKSCLTRDEPPKRVFSPPRETTSGHDTENISIHLETLMGGSGMLETNTIGSATGRETDKTKLRMSEARTLSSARSPTLTDRRTKVVSGLTIPARPTSRLSIVSQSDLMKPTPAITMSPTSETMSAIARRANSSSEDFVQPSTRSNTRRVSMSKQRLRAVPPQIDIVKSDPVPETSSAGLAGQGGPSRLAPTKQTRRASGASTIHTRTPTPELPSIVKESSPLWKNRLNPHVAVVRDTARILSTPELERWVEAGQEKHSAGSVSIGEKHVGWADSDEEVDEDAVDERAISAAPMRRPHTPPGALQLSPIRSSPLRNNAAGNGVHGGAQELLKAVVEDVMYEYHQETREDIKGLHLDLLRMGRSWKIELRSLMDEYVGNLTELREENVNLRKENGRLRRGF